MSLADLRIPSAERLVIAALDELRTEPKSVLATSLGRAQLAVEIEQRFPQARVVCSFLDLYPAREALELLEEQGSAVEVACAPDLPSGECDLAVLPFTRGGESELTRDLLQQGFDRLRVGGVLLTAVDNHKDVWLQHEIEKLQKGVTRMPSRWGVAYRITKKAPLKRRRDFTCEFTFRDDGRLVTAVSRPGVFSHRHLDLGARALLESLTVTPGMRLVDMGCGCGAVGLAAALRAPDVQVLAIDSHARAVECALEGAERNGLAGRVRAIQGAEGEIIEPGTWDVVVGNPPYYSHYTIAELFLQAARRALRKQGEVLMVTKQAEWFVARMEQLFTEVALEDVRGYVVVRARQR